MSKAPEPTRAPSAWQMEQAMAALIATRKRLLEADPDMIADERLFSDMLEGEGGDAIETLHKMCQAALHAESMAEAAERQADDLMLRAKRFKRRAGWCRGAVFGAMEALQLRRMETPFFYASIVDTAFEAVFVTDEEALMKDERFVRTTRTINKTAVKEAIKAGEDVQGAELSQKTQTLRLKGN